MPFPELITGNRIEHNSRERLAQQRRHGSNYDNLRKDRNHTTSIRDPVTVLLRGKDRCKMILPTSSGVDACELGEGPSDAEEDEGDEDDAVNQTNAATGCDGESERCSDSGPAVAEVVADRYDVEAAEMATDGKVAGAEYVDGARFDVAFDDAQCVILLGRHIKDESMQEGKRGERNKGERED